MSAYHGMSRDDLIKRLDAETARADRNGQRADRLEVELAQVRGVLRETCDHVAEQDDAIGELSAENHALKTRLNAASTVKCWTNEDGKRFVFANDLAEALGYKGGEGR